MREEWRIVHQTKSPSLKRLWVFEDGLWQPTERRAWKGMAMPTISGGAPDTIDRQIPTGPDDGERYTGTIGFQGNSISLWAGYDSDPSLLQLHIFLRWTDITLPAGCMITTAYITVWTPSGFLIEGSPELKIFGVDEDNPDAPTTAGEFDADPLTDTAVDWDGLWNLNAWNQSPSIVSVIQELANKRTFSNSAMMLQIRNDKALSGSHYNGCRSKNFDIQWGTALAPKLHIEFEPRIPRPPGYGIDAMIF